MLKFKAVFPLVLFLLASAASASAMGYFNPGDQPHEGSGGSVSTPGPIAGVGVIYLVIAGAGAYLVRRSRRKRD